MNFSIVKEARMSGEIFSLNNEAFRHFAVAGSILIFKMLFMGPLTGKQRFKNKSFVNAEDAGKKNVNRNEDVERVRRSHRNDLENVLPFLSIGLLYLTTRPDATVASYHFYTFTAARFAFCFSLSY